MGQVPVIPSDEWVYPGRINWQACSISVPEKDVQRIPEILVDFRGHTEELGRRARKEWEKLHAPSVRFRLSSA